MEDWVSLKASTICFMQGMSASTMSSGRRTAKGSLPTSSLAMSTAWPRPSGSGWRVTVTLASFETERAIFKQRGLVLGGERGFELGAGVEVVFHGGLAAAGDDDDLGAAGGDGLFDAVLDQRLVDEAEHLLGRGLGGGKKTGAHACGGKDGFADFLRSHWGSRSLGS